MARGRKEAEPSDPVGALLRRIRRLRGFDLRAMSRATGFSVSYLSGIENGHETISAKVITGYAGALGLNVRVLTQATQEERHRQEQSSYSSPLAIDSDQWAAQDLDAIIVSLANDLDTMAAKLRLVARIVQQKKGEIDDGG